MKEELYQICNWSKVSCGGGKAEGFLYGIKGTRVGKAQHACMQVLHESCKIS